MRKQHFLDDVGITVLNLHALGRAELLLDMSKMSVKII